MPDTELTFVCYACGEKNSVSPPMENQGDMTTTVNLVGKASSIGGTPIKDIRSCKQCGKQNLVTVLRNTDGGVPVVKADKPDIDEAFYVQWGKENVKDSIRNANTALSQLLTSSVAALVGIAALWNQLALSASLKSILSIVVFVNVLVCLHSAIPVEDSLNFQDAYSVKAHMDRLIKEKLDRLDRAKSWFTAALLFIVIGIGLHALSLDNWIDDWVKVILSLAHRALGGLLAIFLSCFGR